MIYPNTHVFHKNTKPVRRGFGDTVEVRSTQDQKVAIRIPCLPRGVLNRGAVCVRMHWRSCTDVKEPGWPGESLGVRKQADTQHEGTPLTRWQNSQNDDWGRLKWMNMNSLFAHAFKIMLSLCLGQNDPTRIFRPYHNLHYGSKLFSPTKMKWVQGGHWTAWYSWSKGHWINSYHFRKTFKLIVSPSMDSCMDVKELGWQSKSLGVLKQ